MKHAKQHDLRGSSLDRMAKRLRAYMRHHKHEAKVTGSDAEKAAHKGAAMACQAFATICRDEARTVREMR